MNEKTKRASEFFAKGLYCSQAVLGAFCEAYGMETEAAFRISCGLNNGREKMAKENVFGTTCVEMVRSAAQILEDSGY